MMTSSRPSLMRSPSYSSSSRTGTEYCAEPNRMTAGWPCRGAVFFHDSAPGRVTVEGDAGNARTAGHGPQPDRCELRACDQIDRADVILTEFREHGLSHYINCGIQDRAGLPGQRSRATKRSRSPSHYSTSLFRAHSNMEPGRVNAE